MELVRWKIIDLLMWIKEQGYWPRYFSADDLFVVPIANSIKKYSQLEPHQRATALWIPTQPKLNKILKGKGYSQLDIKENFGVHVANLQRSARIHIGFGVGRSEAILSVMYALRRDQAKQAA
jgi:hypothetical protein